SQPESRALQTLPPRPFCEVPQKHVTKRLHIATVIGCPLLVNGLLRVCRSSRTASWQQPVDLDQAFLQGWAVQVCDTTEAHGSQHVRETVAKSLMHPIDHVTVRDAVEQKHGGARQSWHEVVI